MEIIESILMQGAVLLCLVSFLVIPALPVGVQVVDDRSWPKIVASAFVVGCSVLAVCGVFWSHLVQSSPSAVIFPYLLCLLLIFVVLRRAATPCLPDSCRQETGGPLLFILSIVVLTIVIRSLHPIETTYLGQSDAYTHLHYLHEIVQQGYLGNIIYPPGYHWLLAQPVLFLGIEPYYVARFAGAFFAAALVLSIYSFLDTLFDRRTALFGAFCAAGFPGMTLLMKTGVGSFANQFGLALLPCIFLFYASLFTRGGGRLSCRVMFALSLMGMAATVPMMLIHVFIIIGVERCLALGFFLKKWTGKTFLVSSLLLPALFLVVFHLSQAGPGQRGQTGRILTSGAASEQTVVGHDQKTIGTGNEDGVSLAKNDIVRRVVKTVRQLPYMPLIIDFCTVKRLGFSNAYLDLLAVGLFILFAAAIIRGGHAPHPGFFILGTWGVISVIQAGTGFLQFSSYQREGWSLLIAICCFSGVIANTLYSNIKSTAVKNSLVIICCSVFGIWALLYPPRHPKLHSSAEDVVIRAARFLTLSETESTEKCSVQADILCTLYEKLDKEIPLTIVTRKFVGWGNQGEIVPNVVPEQSSVTIKIIGNEASGEVFQGNNQYVILVDNGTKMSAQGMTTAFEMVAAEQVAATIRLQKQLYRANTILVKYVDGLDEERWNVEKIQLSHSLCAYLVKPRYF